MQLLLAPSVSEKCNAPLHRGLKIILKPRRCLTLRKKQTSGLKTPHRVLLKLKKVRCTVALSFFNNHLDLVQPFLGRERIILNVVGGFWDAG
jgi:hypothetical protein